MCVTDRKGGFHIGEQYHRDIHLCTETQVVGIIKIFFATPVICEELTGEQIELNVVGVALKGAEIVQSYGADVDFTCYFCKAMGADLVDSGARHGIGGSVSEFSSVIHIIVAESAEINVAQ